MTRRPSSNTQQMDQLLCLAEVEGWPDSGPPVIAVAALGILLTTSALLAGMWWFVLSGLH